MPILEWDDSYSVGVELIDSEHKQLIGMINKAYDSIKNMEEEKVLVELVKDMNAYAAAHFGTEEKLMKEHGYPASEGHLKMHDEFAIKAKTLHNFVRSENEIEPVKVFKFLADWLRDHILKTDKDFGKFLNEQGVR
ncbi:bacteriohemerythrin [Desulfovibrio sp. JC010]|uniref:bacteriohemerythrin n=1 Tax=Desulfovibrio sp. JC010 TaxID=2593641 RepID=UPI0013D5C12B|nr:bacteriohemerythrin [Desulfovibrio sp. JC010]NDV26147.1 bacteriohemerythrin [Desulfovibrio sp. JC010]